MPQIKGPTTLGGKITKKMKQYVKKHGLSGPNWLMQIGFTDKETDKWLRVKKEGKKYKYDQKKKKWEEDKEKLSDKLEEIKI